MTHLKATIDSSKKQEAPRKETDQKQKKRANIYHSDMDNDRVQTNRRIVTIKAPFPFVHIRKHFIPADEWKYYSCCRFGCRDTTD
jgi:hypothetical protein